jgi:predicted aspartyl protease
MPVAGTFDTATGCPCVELKVRRTAGGSSPLTINALIDTGFSAFLQIPYAVALILRLPCDNKKTATSKLANGTPHTYPLVPIEASVERQFLAGYAMVGPVDAPALMGMEFLRQFNLVFAVSRGGVLLLEEGLLDAIGREIKQKIKGG